MRGFELRLPFGGAEDAPPLDGDPVGPGEIGCGDDAFALEQLGVTFATGTVGEDGAAISVEIGEDEHLSAETFIANPEDEVGTPLHRLDDVRQGQQSSANLFGVHEVQV